MGLRRFSGVAAGLYLRAFIVWKDSSDYRAENHFLFRVAGKFLLVGITVAPGTSLYVYVRWHFFKVVNTVIKCGQIMALLVLTKKGKHEFLPSELCIVSYGWYRKPCLCFLSLWE